MRRVPSDRRERGCAKKVRYPTEVRAKVSADHFLKKFGPPRAQPYKCEWCGGFHLTKKHAVA